MTDCIIKKNIHQACPEHARSSAWEQLESPTEVEITAEYKA